MPAPLVKTVNPARRVPRDRRAKTRTIARARIVTKAPDPMVAAVAATVKVVAAEVMAAVAATVTMLAAEMRVAAPATRRAVAAAAAMADL